VHGKKKFCWLEKLRDADDVSTLMGTDEPCFLPDRFCTCFVYLNDVPEGGCSRWTCDDPVDFLFEAGLPTLGEWLDKAVPDLGRRRSPPVNVRVTPKEGMAVLHFPCTTPQYMCLTDPLGFHEGEPAITPKFIVQQFIWPAPVGVSETSSKLGYDSNGCPLELQPAVALE
jgi:hypothetical protein